MKTKNARWGLPGKFLAYATASLCLFVWQATHANAGMDDAKAEQKYRRTVKTDAKGRPITVVDFEEASIEGRAKSPEGFVLQSRGQSSFRNIIELRRNFRPQIEASQGSGTINFSH